MDMNYLIILLSVAILLGVLGLVLSFSPSRFLNRWRLWRQGKKQERLSFQAGCRLSGQPARIEPDLDDLALGALGLVGDDTSPAVRDSAFAAQASQAAALTGDAFLVLHLMAPKNRPYVGYELWQALTAEDLQYGEMRIFHRYIDSSEGKSIAFSVASALEPGCFDPSAIGALRCPGLCLFLQIQDTSQAARCFQQMLETGRELAQTLNGTLCDDRRQPLGENALQQYWHRLSKNS